MFTSSTFKGVELNYPKVDKQAYAIFKAVKYFLPYFLKSRTKVIVPFPSVINLLVQKDLGENRENWVTALQENDLEIKPLKIVRGRGLCKLVTEGRDGIKNDNDDDKEELDQAIIEARIQALDDNQDSWYKDLKYLLDTGTTPENLSPKQRRALRLKSTPYQLIQGILFRANNDDVLLRCLEKEDSLKVLNELHEGPAGGHFGGD